MPTYEYKCDACGHQFDQFQSIKAEPLKKCPACGKAKLRRLIGTGAGLIFKGSGFYITDYRDAAYKEKAKAESGGGEAKETKSSDSTSTTGASSSDAKSAPAAATASPAAKSETAGAKPATKPATKTEKGGAAGGKAKSSGKD
jgi:putative FmdB family regulatory protein